MGDAPSRQELEAAHCWENDDRVPGRPAMTEFRRRCLELAPRPQPEEADLTVVPGPRR